MKKLLAILLTLSLLLCAMSALADAIPDGLAGEWRGTGTPKNGGPSIDLSARINADGSGEYTFIQDDYTESYPFTISSDESAFSVDIPADNTLGISACGGTWTLEAGVLKLDITTTFASGGSFSYTAECEKADVPAATPAPEEATASKLLSPSVGDVVTFGHYEQDNDESNGPEEIEWIVLRIKNGGATLISRYALDAMAFSEDEERPTWDVCTLRDWLNGPFIDAAFTSEEQALLKTVEVPAEASPPITGFSQVDPGQATEDRVYLLGYTESELWFESTEARYCQATDYAVARGAFVNDGTGGTWWHLRSPGREAGCCAGVDVSGYTSNYGKNNSNVDAIRPVITLTVDSPDSPEITPTPTPSPSPSPTPLPEDLAALNALRGEAVDRGGEPIENAHCDGDVFVAFYNSSAENAVPQKLTVDSDDEWEFPREYRAESYETARWTALIFPTYETVGYYGSGLYGPANRTHTWLALSDVQTGTLYVEKIAVEEPPESIEVQTINGMPIRAGASGRYRGVEAIARLTELVEAAR